MYKIFRSWLEISLWSGAYPAEGITNNAFRQTVTLGGRMANQNVLADYFFEEWYRML